MHNFGRGMWRRLGDFERIQSPQILKQMQLEQYLLYIENLQRQAKIKAYRENILKQMNSQIIQETQTPVIIAKEKQEEQEDIIIAVETVIPNIEEIPIYKEPISMEDIILPKPKALKKGHKKRK
jgi:hypothetical protein